MKITRKVGIGDLQHVRSNMLSVGILPPCREQQFLGAAQAARHIGQMLRAHIICTPEEETAIYRLILTNQDHQLITHRELSKEVYASLEIAIQLQPEEIVTAEQVKCGIIEVWNAHGGRFAKGNFAKLDAANLARIYLS